MREGKSCEGDFIEKYRLEVRGLVGHNGLFEETASQLTKSIASVVIGMFLQRHVCIDPSPVRRSIAMRLSLYQPAQIPHLMR